MYYDHWFLQFDFPNEDGKPYKTSGGEMEWNENLKRNIPGGWSSVILSEVCHINNVSVIPDSDTIYHHYSIPAFDADKTAAVEYGSEIESNKYKVESQTILVSKLNPKFKRVWHVGNVKENGICSTEFMPFISDDGYVGYLYGVLNSREFSMFMIHGASSSTGSRKRMDPDLCKSYKTVYPDDRVLKMFEHLTSPIMEKITQLREDNHRIISARDYFTPLLLNGQIVIQ